MKVLIELSSSLSKYLPMQPSYCTPTSAQLNITCDASDFAVGGEGLQQCVDNVWQPLSFFSKKLSPAETRYSPFDRQLLAVYATIRHFRHNLECCDFFVNTDHKSLIYVMISTIERPPLRQTRRVYN